MITPSLPTASIAAAMCSPISGSLLPEIAATLAIAFLSVLMLIAFFFRCSTTSSLAFMMPRLSAIGLAPAATLRRPSWITRLRQQGGGGRAVAGDVVGLARHFLDQLRAHVLQRIRSSISLAMVTPSLVIVGLPHFFSSTTLRPRGPSVTLTALATLSTPDQKLRPGVG